MFIFQPISRDYLQPYHSQDCSTYASCMGCISDTACGWCPTKRSCMSRLNWKECKDPDNNQTVYLNRDQTQCNNCQHYVDCFSCVTVSKC